MLLTLPPPCRYGHVEEAVALEPGVSTAMLMEGDIFGSRLLTGEQAVISTLLAPVPKPNIIYGIGLNYRAHAIAVRGKTTRATHRSAILSSVLRALPFQTCSSLIACPIAFGFATQANLTIPSHPAVFFKARHAPARCSRA